MPLLVTTTPIAAPPRIVAAVLMDFASFPQWNPLIRTMRAAETSAGGRPVVGTRLEANLQMSPKHAPMHITPIVECCNDQEFRWRGKVGHASLLGAVHSFSYLPGDNASGNSTHFVHSEDFRGLFGWLFLAVYKKPLHETFSGMNEKLKELAEQRFAEEVAVTAT
ncbi:hypothetical protein BKA62DRAFT_764828 [Auriculariales sp. MPI-PUGE-AT-0066]|nr:hypothetical protein BKA62DRAFT_764828 [Auriculariales sp. MPI-PUGE-AT-0066]